MTRLLRRLGAWAADTEAYRLGADGRLSTVHDRALTWPNAMTLGRGLAVALGLALVADKALLAAIAVLWAAAALDVADGFVARRFGQMSRLGAVLDPVVDQVGTLATVLMLATAGYLPWWLAGLVVLRDLLVAGAALRGERSGRRVQVTRVGKLGSLMLLFGLPGLLLAEVDTAGASFGLHSARLLVAAGLPLTYWSLQQYLSQLRTVHPSAPK